MTWYCTLYRSFDYCDRENLICVSYIDDGKWLSDYVETSVINLGKTKEQCNSRIESIERDTSEMDEEDGVSDDPEKPEISGEADYDILLEKVSKGSGAGDPRLPNEASEPEIKVLSIIKWKTGLPCKN